MFIYVNVDPKLWRQYAETWVFGIFSCCVHQGKYIWGLCHSGVWCRKTLRAPIVRVGYKWSWSWLRVPMSWTSWLYLNMSRKKFGSFLFTNLYQNFIHWTSNISFTFNRYNCLKSGSVWALYLLFVIIRRARFCNFDMRSHSKPQFVIPNWRCERISESYINVIAEMGKYSFSLFITPSVREILFAIFWTYEFQFIYSFTVRPRKLN